MADAVVSGVVKRIGDLLVDEADSLSWVSKQVELLQNEFKLIHVFLKDADLRQDESETLKQLVAEIIDLSYKAENIIAAYAHKFGSRNGGGIQKFVRRCAYIFCEGISVHKVGSQIKDIKARVSNLKTKFRFYDFSSLIENSLVESSSNEPQREVRHYQAEVRQTYSHLQHDVVGFDDDLNILVEFLLRDEEGRVASICGMGGLGKTTLARMVYNHPQVKGHFEFCSWSYISQQCQSRCIWEEILIKLLSPTKEERDGIQKLTNAEIVEKLHEVQLQKKCLVILDDIWDIETWNRLRDAFPLKNIGGKILLTSRNGDVALYVDPIGFHHKLHYLNEERSWELLEKIAISWRTGCVTNINKPNFEKLGKEMIKYCGGLPSAITVLGGILAAKEMQDEWEDVLKHIKLYIFKEDGFGINKVLGLSYNDLPCHLKPCFLYLGHFPEDFEIPTKELIQMWMGEDFIWLGADSEDTMEHAGERYLRELVQRSMVQVGKISKFGRIKTCRIHDVMREFCILKAEQENFLQITKKNIHSMEGSQGHIGKIRRLAITLESNDNYLNEYPYLRSLLYFIMPCKEFYFKKSKLLRVLNLKNYEGENVLEDIGCFIHLRFLSLKNSVINEVPSSLGNLRCLQTLDLRLGCTHRRVPNIFKEMKQLRHLYLPYIYTVREKLELGNLCCLQTLLNVVPETIKMLTNFPFNYLRILRIENKNQDCGERPHLLQILVSSCPCIYKLYVHYRIEKLLEFSPNLAVLDLDFTWLEEDPMPTLEKLPNLKILRLSEFSFEGKDMVCSKGGFPLLQYLRLGWLYKLEEWRVEEGAMPGLCHLEISGCQRLKTIPNGLRFVTTLRELEIRNMLKSFKDRLDEGGQDFDKVKHVPSLVFECCW